MFNAIALTKSTCLLPGIECLSLGLELQGVVYDLLPA